MPLALIIDDEKDICELLSISLGRLGIDVKEANDVSSAKRLLAQYKFDICLTDMRLPDGSGLELVSFIHAQHRQLPVAVITAHGNMETAVTALKAGAFDFVSKPIDVTMLKKLLDTGLQLSKKSDAKTNDVQLLGVSDAMKKLLEQVGKVARSHASVHIHGASGTGKELVARLIHQQSERADKPFVAINCGAIPSELMESEFFGYKKGSFTGADRDKNGLFKSADGGTLFLDEIADLPLHMQVKLLRVIQEGKIRPIGSIQEINIDVRLLSATHKVLKKLVQEETFREDLYYRVNVIELDVPPLTQRRDDIPLLVEHILTSLTRHSHLDKPKITAAALQRLSEYHYPGNVRELENILERAVALCDNHTITDVDLQLDHSEALVVESAIATEAPLPEQLENIEKQRIIDMLEKNHWNKTATAKALGISFRVLRYRLDKLGIV